jgi:hypothetical protein
VSLKERQAQTLARIRDPQLRALVAAELGLSDEAASSKPPVTWPGRPASDTRKPSVLD